MPISGRIQVSLNPKLLSLAEEKGVLIDTGRSAFGSYVWDGVSIATSTRHWNIWDDDYDVQRFSDSMILHEIAHWMVANEHQRSLPEWGLDQFYLKVGEIVPGILSKDEQKYLEKKAMIQTEKLERLFK